MGLSRDLDIALDIAELAHRLKGTPTSVLVLRIGAHAARVEMARMGIVPVPSDEERLDAEATARALDLRLPAR